MFSEHSSESVGFSSAWKSERAVCDGETQTNDCHSVDKEAQAVTSRHAEIQTEEKEQTSCAPQVDYSRLASFLNRVCPAVVTELEKNNRSRAFDDLRYANNYEDDITQAQKLYTVQPSSAACDVEVKVTGVSWNCNGSILAVASSAVKHEAWCDHRGSVSLYSVSRKNFDATAAPQKTLETTSCTTALAYHPYVPSVLAAGTFSGHVIVWKEGGEIEMSSCLHKDMVSQVLWLSEHMKSQPLLISSGRDGRLLSWHVSTTGSNLQLAVGFMITMDHGIQRIHSPLGSHGVGKELGIMCFSFFKQDSSSFVVGVEGGGVLRCSTLTSKPSTVSDPDIPLTDPVLSSFQHHIGAVTCVMCSPHDRDLFVSCGTDETLHIYSYLQNAPMQCVHTRGIGVSLTWWPTEDNLIAVWGTSLEIINVLNCDKIAAPKLNGLYPISCVSSHPQSTYMVAIGNVRGSAAVWRVPLKMELGNQ
ncbi:cytoplasmic dynein 2 intermediate chain 2-like [Schistocerca piceifrons]|uniref:cytoplasmic dynein 2 intermediate chain 2-like n=1 Tax=Schistocerca piceifrons TaxID=274613 RepID=UPI001F5E7215|nr:cytoplasmic dynein 2 intermediate chain 2-like [Schistocerca piceifrons]